MHAPTRGGNSLPGSVRQHDGVSPAAEAALDGARTASYRFLSCCLIRTLGTSRGRRKQQETKALQSAVRPAPTFASCYRRHLGAKDRLTKEFG